MTAPQTPAAPTPGEEARRRGVAFWFDKPSQDELRERLAAVDAARHAQHAQPDRFCPLCDWGRGA